MSNRIEVPQFRAVVKRYQVMTPEASAVVRAAMRFYKRAANPSVQDVNPEFKTFMAACHRHAKSPTRRRK